MTRTTIELPRLHRYQAQVLGEAVRFNVVACGRRWGKTLLGEDVAINGALDGLRIAWGAPNYKYLDEAWHRMSNVLAPVTRHRNATERTIELMTGGRIDFWTLADQNVGRSYAYDRWVVDEAAMVPKLWPIWNEAIRPTLTDRRGGAWFLSTPKGRDAFWQLFSFGQDPERREWASWKMPTALNPTISGLEDEIEAARTGGMPERSFQQEYLADFVEDGGGVFRNVLAAIDKGRSANSRLADGEWAQIGVDVARLEDYTVVSAFTTAGRQVWFDRINQVSWERVYDAVKRAHETLGGQVVVDATGVGDPVYERLSREGVPCKPYNFTSASKEALMDNLAAMLERGRVRLMDVDVQTNELLAYRYEMTASRRVRMSAPEGMHDDCVCALALACHGMDGRDDMRPWDRLRSSDPPKREPLERDRTVFDANSRILEEERQRRIDRDEEPGGGIETPALY